MIQIVGNPLNQWDVGRLVQVTGEASHVHFANQGDSVAVIIDIEDGKAKIPDYLLQTGRTLFAYSVLNGVTLERVVFSVRKRERPENYVYEDDQRNYIYQLISDAQDAAANANAVAKELYEAKENGEFKGEKGEKGDKGDPGNSSEPLIVTYDGQSEYASHSSEDIANHVADGGLVFLEYVDEKISLTCINAYGACFDLLYPDLDLEIRYIIDGHGRFYDRTVNLATEEEIGDLNAALAEILAYAKSLTSGGES